MESPGDLSPQGTLTSGASEARCRVQIRLRKDRIGGEAASTRKADMVWKAYLCYTLSLLLVLLMPKCSKCSCQHSPTPSRPPRLSLC